MIYLQNKKRVPMEASLPSELFAIKYRIILVSTGLLAPLYLWLTFPPENQEVVLQLITFTRG